MGKHSNIDRIKISQPDEKPPEGKIQSSRPKRSVWGFLFISILIGLCVAVAGFTYIYKVTPADVRSSFTETIKFVTSPGETFFQGRDSVNILCLGLDYNYTTEGIIFSKYARTDTIFVVNVNKDGAINILSIPRDSRVKIAGDEYGYDKVNTAYALGELPLAKKTIEDFLGIPLDYYAIIRIKATKELIDAIGGITVDVEKDIDYDDNWGHTHIHLKKGLQKLDGDQAVGYSRFRYDEEGDRGRIRRQQQVLKALVLQLKDPRNITRTREIARVIKNNLETDITPTQMFDLARLYKKFNAANVHTDRIEGADEDIDGISYLIPDDAEKQLKVNRMFRGITNFLPKEITVNIYNGTQKTGVAHILGDKLGAEGYFVDKIGDYKDINKEAPADTPNTLVIIRKTDKKEAVEMLVRSVGMGQVSENIDPNAKVDFDIVVGNDLAPYLGE